MKEIGINRNKNMIQILIHVLQVKLIVCLKQPLYLNTCRLNYLLCVKDRLDVLSRSILLSVRAIKRRDCNGKLWSVIKKMVTDLLIGLAFVFTLFLTGELKLYLFGKATGKYVVLLICFSTISLFTYSGTICNCEKNCTVY